MPSQSFKETIRLDREEKIRESIRLTLASIDGMELPATTNFFSDLGADQLDLHELSELLEEQFAIKIPVADLKVVQTVQDVYNLVDRLKNATPATPPNAKICLDFFERGKNSPARADKFFDAFPSFPTLIRSREDFVLRVNSTDENGQVMESNLFHNVRRENQDGISILTVLRQLLECKALDQNAISIQELGTQESAAWLTKDAPKAVDAQD